MKKRILLWLIVAIILIGIGIPNIILATEEKDIFEKIDAPNLLLAETNSGRVLYERNIDEKIYPASVTKLLTAILVVENCELDEIVTISENAVKSVPSGYVNANLQVGEELTIKDLLYVMLIPSANDAANALAEYVGGSIESFAAMMNTKAKELGCIGSHFTNPSGLHEEEHYITTRDLYLIGKEAIQNNTIKKIIGTTTYTLPSTNAYTKESRIFTSTNYMKLKNLTKYYCNYCIGGKTGYTGEAKNCVIEFAQKDGIELTAIVMGETAKQKGQKFLDAKEMFEYIFQNYENKKMTMQNEKFEEIKIANGTKETQNLNVLYKMNLSILINKKDNQKIEKKVEYEKTKAPIQKGETIGKITYTYQGAQYTVELIAENEVVESKVLKNTLGILMILLILYIIYHLKKSKLYSKKHGRKIKKEV